MTPQKAELLELKAQLVAYCAQKLKVGDWHAVQDCATDIREVDAKIAMLAELGLDGPNNSGVK